MAGHTLLTTSRPAGISEARFAGFHRLSLVPLTEAQQEQAVVQRVGQAQSQALLAYLRGKVPIDTETKGKVTSNPLMLAMFASVYELRTGLPMPTTVAELYELATDVMLARGGVASGELRRLLVSRYLGIWRVSARWAVSTPARMSSRPGGPYVYLRMRASGLEFIGANGCLLYLLIVEVRPRD